VQPLVSRLNYKYWSGLQVQSALEKFPTGIMSRSIIFFKGSASGDIVQAVTELPKLKDAQVLVEVRTAALCGTDLHYVGQDLAMGHEGAGIVMALGPKVRYLVVYVHLLQVQYVSLTSCSGDRVGFGWFQGGCGKCDECLVGEGPQCQVARSQFGSHPPYRGAFGSHVIWEEDFLHLIPDGMALEDAPPFMCAGMTVFTPLARYGAKPTDRVGVVGIGALGHLAIQFASKMGCEVIAFSSTKSKEADARALGATHFIATKDKTELTLPGKGIKHLMVTTSRLPEFAT